MKSQLFSIAITLLVAISFASADEDSSKEKSTQKRDNVPACCSQTESKDDHMNCDHSKEETSKGSKAEDSGHQHHADVDRRGDEVMGFDHTKTTHHFYLKPDGGIIQVTANSASDSDSRTRIRTHLKEVSNRFQSGDFAPAKQIHDREPSGANTMTQLKSEIEYLYQEISDGARVVIQTKNEEAREAVHEFLKFQIQDHRTGDPLKVQP